MYEPNRQTLKSIPRLVVLPPLLLWLAACSDAAPSAPAIGERFPLEALAGASPLNDFSRELQGKALLVNFWATWCEPCRREMPVLQQLSDRLDADRFAVIGVSVDEDTNLALEFLLERGIRFGNLQDSGQPPARQALGILSYPQTFLVAPDGRITARIDEILDPGDPGLAAWYSTVSRDADGSMPGGY